MSDVITLTVQESRPGRTFVVACSCGRITTCTTMADMDRHIILHVRGIIP